MCNSVVKSKEKYINKYTLYIHKNIKYIQVYILQHPSTHKYDVTLVKNDQMCVPTLPAVHFNRLHHPPAKGRRV